MLSGVCVGKINDRDFESEKGSEKRKSEWMWDQYRGRMRGCQSMRNLNPVRSHLCHPEHWGSGWNEDGERMKRVEVVVDGERMKAAVVDAEDGWRSM